ncbi:MAG: restriction endonuclease [Pseudomonadaceae bacterium]|nr:restriction endonuclease [Pseudomonadaceae bacterium]
MSLWLARSGKYGQLEERFLSDDSIYLGWDDLFETDLTNSKTSEDIRKVLQAVYPQEPRGRISNWTGQISVFTLYMKPGDLVVMPLKKKPAVAIGEVQGGYQFDRKAEGPFRHSRKVKWIKTILRTNIDRDLLYSFGAFMTFCQIERNNAEERVKKLLKGDYKPAVTQHATDDSTPPVPDETSAPTNFEELARDQLATSIIRKFKGEKLEMLVEAILKAQGFTTYRSPTGTDKGVDLLAAPGTLGFGTPRICVQVKSSDSPVDRPILDQLVGTMKRVNADQGLLVAWGGFKDTVEKERPNQFFAVRFWNQNDLIHELTQVYDRIDDTIKAELPLKRLWVVADSETDD